MSDDNGATLTDHQTNVEPATTQRGTSTGGGRGRDIPPSPGAPSEVIRAAGVAALQLDAAAVRVARGEIARRYGLLAPDPSTALAVLVAEGLGRCQQAWTEKREHAVDVAGFNRQAKAKQTRVEVPHGLVDAVRALADLQYRGVPGMGALVASAALLAGVAASAKVKPVTDPGLDALARYCEGAS